MSDLRAFNEKRPDEDSGYDGKSGSNSSGNAGVTESIDILYKSLLEYGYTYDQLCSMTLRELIDTLEARNRMLGYTLWKTAYLTAWAAMDGKTFPKKPEKASPELYPKPVTIPMPEGLRNKIGR